MILTTKRSLYFLVVYGCLSVSAYGEEVNNGLSTAKPIEELREGLEECRTDGLFLDQKRTNILPEDAKRIMSNFNSFHLERSEECIDDLSTEFCRLQEELDLCRYLAGKRAMAYLQQNTKFRITKQDPVEETGLTDGKTRAQNVRAREPESPEQEVRSLFPVESLNVQSAE